MQHKVTLIIESQIRNFPNGKNKLFIQARINSYDLIEVVARDRIDEKVDEVYLGIISNNEECDSKVDEYISPIIHPSDSTTLELLDKNDSCSQLFVTLRSKVTRIYINMLNYLVSDIVKKKEELKEKKYQEKKNKKKEKVSPIEIEEIGKEYEEADIDDDYLGMPKESQKYLKKIKTKKINMKDVNNWTANQFGQMMRKKFESTYGISSFEFTSFKGHPNMNSAKGKEWTVIKQKLMDVFTKNGFCKADIVDYINWMFDEKSKDVKFPLNLGFVCNKTLITEWIVAHNNVKSYEEAVNIDELEFDM